MTNKGGPNLTDQTQQGFLFTSCLDNQRSHLVQNAVLGSGDGGIQDIDPGFFLLWTDGEEDEVGNLQQSRDTTELVHTHATAVTIGRRQSTKMKVHYGLLMILCFSAVCIFNVLIFGSGQFFRLLELLMETPQTQK